MNFSENLASLRKSKNLSQEEIADRLGVSRQAISKWENGQALPETANIMKLCEILEVTPNELLGYEEIKTQPNGQLPYDNEGLKEEKKKWYKSTPFKVFAAVLGALLAVQLIKVLVTLGFAGVFMTRSNPDVVVGEVASVEAGEENISTGGTVKFSTQGTNGKKTIIRTEYVPNVYSNAYDCSFAFSGDGMPTLTEEAKFEGGMWLAEVELPQISGAIEVVFITDTGYKKVPVKVATITGIDECSVSWQ